MGASIGKSYSTGNDTLVPQVTNEMYVHAVRVICGLAWNVDDARFLMESLGIPEDVIKEARRIDGHDFGLV